MGKLDAYKLPLKSLSIGRHSYDYLLDTNWFTLIDGPEVRKGNVKATAVVENTGLAYNITFSVSGKVLVPCDRCLEDMPVEIEQQSHLVVKFGEEYREESDEVMIIPESDGELNIAWFLYEIIALAIPMKHVHLPGQCNREMAQTLRKHLAHRPDDEDGFEDSDFLPEDGSQDSFEPFGQEEPEQSNPIWDELKKMTFDDNN